jgi:hypothetical protein
MPLPFWRGAHGAEMSLTISHHLPSHFLWTLSYQDPAHAIAVCFQTYITTFGHICQWFESNFDLIGHHHLLKTAKSLILKQQMVEGVMNDKGTITASRFRSS